MCCVESTGWTAGQLEPSQQTVAEATISAASTPSPPLPADRTTTQRRPPFGDNRKPYISNPIGRIQVTFHRYYVFVRVIHGVPEKSPFCLRQ